MKMFKKIAGIFGMLAIIASGPVMAACNTCVVATGNKTVDVWAGANLVFQFTPDGVIFKSPVIADPSSSTNPFGDFAPLNNPVFTGNVTVPNTTPTKAGSSLALNISSANSYYAPLVGAVLSGSPQTNNIDPSSATSAILNATSARAYFAPINSPALTGTPTAPTQPVTNNSTAIATTSYSLPRGGIWQNAASGSITSVTAGENILYSYPFTLQVASRLSILASFNTTGPFPTNYAGCTANTYISGQSGHNPLTFLYSVVTPYDITLAAGSYTLIQSVTCNSAATTAYWGGSSILSIPQ